MTSAGFSATLGPWGAGELTVIVSSNSAVKGGQFLWCEYRNGLVADLVNLDSFQSAIILGVVLRTALRGRCAKCMRLRSGLDIRCVGRWLLTGHRIAS